MIVSRTDIALNAIRDQMSLAFLEQSEGHSLQVAEALKQVIQLATAEKAAIIRTWEMKNQTCYPR